MKARRLPACITDSSALVAHAMLAIFCSHVNTVINGRVNDLPITDANSYLNRFG
jgi:hypothetical protein